MTTKKKSAREQQLEERILENVTKIANQDRQNQENLATIELRDLRIRELEAHQRGAAKRHLEEVDGLRSQVEALRADLVRQAELNANQRGQIQEHRLDNAMVRRLKFKRDELQRRVESLQQMLGMHEERNIHRAREVEQLRKDLRQSQVLVGKIWPLLLAISEAADTLELEADDAQTQALELLRKTAEKADKVLAGSPHLSEEEDD